MLGVAVSRRRIPAGAGRPYIGECRTTLATLSFISAYAMRSFVPTAAALLVVSGCFDLGSPTAPEEVECLPITSTPVVQRGDTVVTTSGLEYLELSIGSGAEAVSCELLAATLVGSLEDGTIFVDTGDTPAQFLPGVQDLPIGLAQGFIGMRVGGSRRLIVPPELGFGTQVVLDDFGGVLVPPSSTLIFDIELFQVVD
jgi:peptidylprolyl isomerase